MLVSNLGISDLVNSVISLGWVGCIGVCIDWIELGGKGVWNKEEEAEKEKRI